MTSTDIYAYLAYLIYLVWMIQGGRVLAMMTTGSWDKSPPLKSLVPSFLRRKPRSRR